MNAITNSIVIAFLVALAYYDIRTRLVDDRLVLLGMVVVAPLQCWLRGWEFALSGLVCGLLVSYAAYLLSRCIHRERTGFGGGDVTAAAFIGLAVG